VWVVSPAESQNSYISCGCNAELAGCAGEYAPEMQGRALDTERSPPLACWHPHSLRTYARRQVGLHSKLVNEIIERGPIPSGYQDSGEFETNSYRLGLHQWDRVRSPRRRRS
jgi:hypothetical protein